MIANPPGRLTEDRTYPALRKTPRRRHNFRRGAAFSCAFYEMNFFRSYPEGGSGALGICIYYVLSYISFSAEGA